MGASICLRELLHEFVDVLCKRLFECDRETERTDESQRESWQTTRIVDSTSDFQASG